jgi:hypothetical protein
VTNKFQDVVISEELELLADFVLDVPVARVKSPEIALEVVHLFQRECRLPELSDTRQDIRRPPSHFRGFPIKEGELLPRLSHTLLRHDSLGRNYGNPPVVWKSIEQDIAANPPRAPRRRREWWTFFDYRLRHEVLGDS